MSLSTPYPQIVIANLHHRPARNRSLAITYAKTGGKQITTGAETHESNPGHLCGSPLALNRERGLKRGWTGSAEALAWSRPGTLRGGQASTTCWTKPIWPSTPVALYAPKQSRCGKPARGLFTHDADRLWRLRIPTASISQRDLDRHRQSTCIMPSSSRKTAGLKTILAHYEASK
jgi:hypothetical protein